MLGIANLLIGPVSELLDKVVTDQDERARLAHEIATMADKQAHEIALAQIELNKTEAANAGGGWMGLFRAGWRPAVGWLCVAAFAWFYLLQPILVFAIVASGNEAPALPEFDMNSLMTVLLGLLGLGGMRTLERIRGVDPR
jgi:hypothetical protein